MLLVDPRAGSKDLVEPLRKAGLVVDDKMYLPFGDIAFEGRGIGGKPVDIGIEYKKLPDLLDSLTTGRLSGHQLIGMRPTYEFNWLLIEGELLYNRSGRLMRRRNKRGYVPMAGNFTISELYKRLLTLQLNGGLVPVWARTQRDSVNWITAAYRFWTDKDLDQHRSHIQVYEAPTLIPISDYRAFFMRLPGIGLKTSSLVEAHFGTPYAAMNASPGEWMTIEGIGPGTATKIVNFILGRK